MNRIDSAAEQRIKAIKATSEEKRHALAQHLTPPETALLAASMFSDVDKPIECLDIGAGTGMLSVALVNRYDGAISHIDCLEADAILAKICDEELQGTPHSVIVDDVLVATPEKEYDRAILNPPYKKMASNDERQKLLPVHSANLYSAFLAIALSRLADDGECVAIIPRSWMNGDYFTPFRQWALGQFSLDHIHIYGSRTEVFEDTNVLQETMLVRFSKRPQANIIKVSQSTGKGDEITTAEHRAEDLIVGDTKVVRIAPPSGNITETVASRGYCPSTGKVVDFRSRERIYRTYEEAKTEADESNIYRLVYVGNFRTGEFVHPADIGKCQWYRADDKSSIAQLIQPGSYVLVKRFSSKEEPRRVRAYPITIEEPTAFENHSSFIHAGTPRKVVPLASPELARGIAIWLNTTFIDEWFRDVSGSTQVNAKDIKAMPCPSTEALLSLGKGWKAQMTQEDYDKAAEGLV